MASARLIVAITNTGPITFGSRWPSTILIGRTPMTRAAWMYSLLRSTKVIARTVRAYCTQKDSAIAAIRTKGAISGWASRGSTPRATPSINSAIRMAGKLSFTSATRMMIVSVSPPRQPAVRPSATPVESASSTAETPTTSDSRDP